MKTLLLQATATDICDSNPVITYTDADPVGQCPVIIVRTWTATDECGNVSTCEQTLTISDTTAPELLLPVDIEIECGESTDPIMTGQGIPTDDCSGLDVSFTDVEVDNADCLYTIERTWIAVDGCGNTTTMVQNITIVDTTSPVLVSSPVDVSLECNEQVPAIIDATFSDTCDDDVEVLFSESTETTACGYILTRTWTATDDCGNTESATQTITVEDTQSPEFFSIPSEVIASCDAIPAPANPQAFDNCDAIVEVTYNGEVFSGDLCNGSIIRTWTAADDCGNETMVSQTIIITDSSAPEFVETVPADVEVSCSDIPEAIALTAQDNCDTDVTVEMTEETSTGTCPYTITRTYTATDNCGNTTEGVQVITVIDNEAPVIGDYDASITVNCEELVWC